MGMSGDESDHEAGKRSRRCDRQYKIVNDNWRNPAIRRWLRILDLLYLVSKFNSLGRASKGTWPRVRNPSYKVVEGVPISGLPKNFYDPIWVADLSEAKCKALDMKPAMNLSFEEEILRYVYTAYQQSETSNLSNSIAARFANVDENSELAPEGQEDVGYFIEWLDAQGPPDNQNVLSQ